MSAFPGRSGRRVALIKQLAAWKAGEHNPAGEDGKPAPLRVMILRIMGDGSGQPINQWTCDAKMNHVERTDEILSTCDEYANEVSSGGEEIVFALFPYFGTDRQPGTVFPIRITPTPRFEGPDKFASAMDYREPKNQAAAAFKESLSLTRESWALVGGTMRITIESLERQVERLTAENQALKADREKTWELQQKMMDHQLDRELRYRKESVQIAAMEAGANKLISYLPVLTSKLDLYIAEKMGMKNTPEDESNRYREAMKNFLSKFNDSGKARKVIEALELSDVEAMQLYNFGKEFLMEEQRAKMSEEANAATRGLMPMAPIRSLPIKSR